MSHLSPLHIVAAGLRALPDVAKAFAATQAAWRFYANPKVPLPRLAGPLVAAACAGVREDCDGYALVVCDWSNLHYTTHESKADRVELTSRRDWGYELLTALVVSDRDGSPLAPVALELRAKEGVYTTRSDTTALALSPLDGLDPMMRHVDALPLSRPRIYIIDREADSVAHFRLWAEAGRTVLVRANDARLVRHGDRERTLIAIAKEMAKTRQLRATREVTIKGQKARQFVGQTQVVLHRPARTHRAVGRGKNRRWRHKNIPGAAIPLRLVVCEVRDDDGKLLARWLLLSNATLKVSAATLALWYYWRWRIESYHKLIKGAGLHIQQWLQDDALALSKRLAVAAMAVVVVWKLARNEHPQARKMRQTLVRLSGRQIKRGKNRPTFTIPALLAGLGMLLPMLYLLDTYRLDDLRRLAKATLPHALLPPGLAPDDDSG
jgi:hypothetical protein